MNQHDMYSLLDKYSQGIEPLENWETGDLLVLIDLVEAEIASRNPEFNQDQSFHNYDVRR